MRVTYVPLVLLLALAACAADSPSIVVSNRVIVERESLNVFGADTFPKDLACEVYIGSGPFPCFFTKGARGAT